MKHLKFSVPALEEKLLDLAKLQTIRHSFDFKIAERREVWFCKETHWPPHAHTQNCHRMGRIIVLGLQYKKGDELDEEDARLDGLASLMELLAELARLYKQDLAWVLSTGWTIVTFGWEEGPIPR